MQSKKSVGLSISMIIVAIIALAVLFIIIAVFTNVTEKTSGNIGSCGAKGGVCADDSSVPVAEKPRGKCGGDYPVPLIVSDEKCKDTDPKYLCCLRIKND